MNITYYKSIGGRAPVPPSSAKYPCIVLVTNTWNDYGHITLHHLHFFENPDVTAIALGDTKILQSEQRFTEIPDEFTDLKGDFVSLGQNLQYYSAMLKIFPHTYTQILGGLNDVVVKPQLLEGVETSTGFRNSLVRFNEAKLALLDGAAALSGTELRRSYRFTYSGQIPNALESTKVDFNLDAKDMVPGRVCAIIGRNGVGKTQFLADLAMNLATPQRLSKDRADLVDQAFSPSRPLFSRVIALSFSAFDKFLRPQPKEFFSYIYCGVRDDDGGLSRTALESKHLKYLQRIQQQGRSSVWERHVANVMEHGGITLQQTIESLESGVETSMSSGQSILIYFISSAVAYLKENSLLLFDEPEIHLHPNAVATLIQVLHALVKEYDSYAVIATHSPVVIQEIPRRRVIRFEREGNITTALPLDQESFGENISELTRYVFETVEISNFYKVTLKKLSETHNFEQVSSLFGDALSMHAMAYLASLYENA